MKIYCSIKEWIIILVHIFERIFNLKWKNAEFKESKDRQFEYDLKEFPLADKVLNYRLLNK
jgi:hypothetical protein